jgi:hypothetical protein
MQLLRPEPHPYAEQLYFLSIYSRKFVNLVQQIACNRV